MRERNRLKSPKNWVWVISFMETSSVTYSHNGGIAPCAFWYASATRMLRSAASRVTFI